ncbi:phage replisome organizer N-terminal domain-containing protein [Clostridium sp.]|uniref:phage replisome organizer N-terminal domain-containing protein n=1 Tax=Clostridium sp. TaxID=1506 RepID=UPI00283CAC41|nr:phage replisome organizer N-terminal domain-containing protein [Clostridium sp.]MDR3594050.1 phage replisome organizer N-terminal domain-containing protein [Clostridium sp.]
MRERRYVKFKVDMYDDTKFKIIDMKPERDFIHYVWTRLVTLAGKVNLDGELYMSKNIPYTIETLGIEFNRGIDQIKLALDVFIEFEMIELTKYGVYRVKNFVKHQNIKVKEKNKSEDAEEAINKIEVQGNEALKDDIVDDKESYNKKSEKVMENSKDADRDNLKITSKDISNVTDSINDEKSSNNSKDNVPIILETKKSRKTNRKKKEDKIIDINVMDEEVEDNSICCITDGVRPLREGESTVAEFSFG